MPGGRCSRFVGSFGSADARFARRASCCARWISRRIVVSICSTQAFTSSSPDSWRAQPAGTPLRLLIHPACRPAACTSSDCVWRPGRSTRSMLSHSSGIEAGRRRSGRLSANPLLRRRPILRFQGQNSALAQSTNSYLRVFLHRSAKKRLNSGRIPRRKAVRVQPAREPNRVLLRELAGGWVVVAVALYIWPLASRMSSTRPPHQERKCGSCDPCGRPPIHRLRHPGKPFRSCRPGCEWEPPYPARLLPERQFGIGPSASPRDSPPREGASVGVIHPFRAPT